MSNKKNGSHGDDPKVMRLPVAHRDIKVQLQELIGGLKEVRAGILIVIDEDLRSTCASMVSKEASELHLAACLADVEILKHRLVVLLDSDRDEGHLTDEPEDDPS